MTDADVIGEVALATDDQIERGKALVRNLSKNLWALGDLTLEVCTLREQREREGLDETETVSIQEFADAIGTSYSRLHSAQWVARTYPPNKRNHNVPWEVHRILVAHPDRDKLIHRDPPWTIHELREWLAEEPNDKRPVASARKAARKRRAEAAAAAEPVTIPETIKTRPENRVVPLGSNSEMTALDFLRQARTCVEEAARRGLGDHADIEVIETEIVGVEDKLHEIRALLDVSSLR